MTCTNQYARIYVPLVSLLVKAHVFSSVGQGWETGKLFKAVSHSAQGTGSSAVPLIYYFAICGPVQGDEIRETVIGSVSVR